MQHSKTPLAIIGSRGSPLALVQAHDVQARLVKAWACTPEQVPIKTFTTSGDKLKGRLTEFGGKGLFVKELDEALYNGDIDLAVHSMKDVPTKLDNVFALPTILPREDVRDAFISPRHKTLLGLPQGVKFGTASLRRQAQLKRLRPDLDIGLLRGNVGSRLSKLERGDCEATFLAMAGLRRLGQEDVVTHPISTEDMLPAPAQGAVGIQIRSKDTALAEKLAPLNCVKTQIAITAERAFLRALDGSCRTPVAALAELHNAVMRFRGQALTPDGRLSFARDVMVTLGDNPSETAEATGYALGMDIRFEAGNLIEWTGEAL